MALLDAVKIDYYGTLSPVNQVANIAAPDSRLLTVKPWDKSMLKVIEKSILESNLGLTPVIDGDIVRIPIPPLTEERRREFAKQVRQRGEDSKISVRNARRDANEMIKEGVKDKALSEDDEKRGLKMTQEATDQAISEIDKLLEHKESEIMVV